MCLKHSVIIIVNFLLFFLLINNFLIEATEYNENWYQ